MKKLLYVILAALFALSTACGENGDNGEQIEWECDNDHNGWERCTNNRIQYCHAGPGMEPHYHWGTNCDGMGLTCMVVDDQGNAVCVDESVDCTAADEKCEDNTAYYCVDGKLAVVPCGTANVCHVHDGVPECEPRSEECGGHGHLHGDVCHCDEGYVLDPDDPTNCVSEFTFDELACMAFDGTASVETAVSSFADFRDAHVSLDTPYEITLPAGSESFVHFPVPKSGEYVVFLSDPDVFDAFLHRSGDLVDPPAAGGVAIGECSARIQDHWHTDLVFDGDIGAPRVPYIIRFKSRPAGGTVRIMIMREEEAPFPLQSCDLFRAERSDVDPVTEFSDFPNAHADLEKPYEVELPDNQISYLHFPVSETAHYVIFLSNPDYLHSVMHRDGTSLASELSGGTPNGRCPTLIEEHWHIDLEFDGTGEATRVPYILAFEAVPGGATVSFMIRKR